MTGEALAALVVASSGLDERVDNRSVPVTGPRQRAEAHRQLERWKGMFTDAGPDAFAERLALDGWTEAMITPYLAEVRSCDGEQLPSWAQVLAGCVEAMLTSVDVDPHDRVRPGRQPALFEQLFWPAVDFAARALRRRIPLPLRLLSPSALADAEATLLTSLVQVSAGTLSLEFQTFRSLREPALFRMLRRAQQEASDELYRDFLSQLRAGALLDLLSTYPVLGRLWGLTVQAWTDTLTEMAQRLDRDRSLLHTHLGTGVEDPVLEHLTMELSDRHHSGRSVMLLAFQGGQRIVYKPKGLGLEKAFGDLLSWLAESGAPVRLRAVEVLDRGAYGWVEYVDATGCAHRADVAAYYRRAGGLLCLVHLLEGTDCHLENLVAAGADPVLVDAEALLHHRAAPDPSTQHGDQDARAAEQHWRSVLRTGLLPSWTVDHNGHAVDTSGLGGFGEQATSRQFLRWENVDTDDVQLGRCSGQLPHADNVPVLDGTPQSPLDFQSDLVVGFTQMYRFCQRKKRLLTGPNSPLYALRPHRSRFIARDSALYGQLIAALLEPLALTSGVAQTLQLEILALAHLTGARPPGHWPLVQAEIAALQRRDIPYFDAVVGSADLDLPAGTRLPGFFADASIREALGKISRTSEADLRTQVRYIQATFFSRATEHTHLPQQEPPPDTRFTDPPGEPPHTLHARQFVAEAERLAQQLDEETIHPDGGEANWLGLDYDAATRRYRYQPLGYGFYGGRTGIGIFLAALWSVTGQDRWRELAYSAVVGLRNTVCDASHPIRWSVSDAGMAYALGRMGVLLGDEHLIHDAHCAATRIPTASIESDQVFDVLSGSAGALLSFLFLHRCSSEDAMLEQAVSCGERLLRGRVATSSGHRAWARLGSPALTGLSHGAAGGAYALLRLFEVTGECAYREAALEAMAFERSVFNATAGNWPDLRSDGSAGPGFMSAWCHGATGIGLSRFRTRKFADSGVHEEVEVALAATRRARSHELDQLCCGSFGRIEFLVTAGTELSRPQLVAEARSWATARVSQARLNRVYDVMPRLPREVRSYGFLQGTSGIGYELLRLAHPAKLPVVLLWE